MFVNTKIKLFNVLSIILCIVVYCPFIEIVHIFGVVGMCFVLLYLSLFIKSLERFKMLLTLLLIIAIAKLVAVYIDLDYPLDAAVALVPILIYFLIFHRKLLKLFFCSPPKGNWVRLFSFYVLVSIIGLVVWSYLSENVSSELDWSGFSTKNRVLIGVAFSIMNAFYEEFLFRGCMITAFLQTNHTTVATIVPSASFAVMHYVAGFPNGISGLILTFIYGILMGHLFIKTRSLWPSMLAHILCDASVFVMLLMEV